MNRANNDPATILVIDDDPLIHRMVTRIFRHRPYAIRFVDSGPKALADLERVTPDLILLDLSMPHMDGFEVAEKIKRIEEMEHVPVIILTGLSGMDILPRALGEYADDFISKTADSSEIIARVQYHLSRKRVLDQLHSDRKYCHHAISLTSARLALALKRLKDASLEVIWRLTAATEYRDNETGAHIHRMSRYAAAIARQMGLKPKTVETILYAAPMHDIGKIGIPDCILQKEGPLNDTEWKIMKTHTTIGAAILRGSSIGFVRLGEVIALTHHEKWDGSGYPNGLSGHRIPLLGRIVALADVFDALTSKRPYKEAFSIESAHRVIIEGAGAHFDPDVVRAFFSIQDEIREINMRFQEKRASAGLASLAGSTSCVNDRPATGPMDPNSRKAIVTTV